MNKLDPASVFNAHRDRYIKILEPLFLPDDVTSHDIIRYFASLLRVLGMEDKGWDPYAESRNILNDLNRLMRVELPEKDFPDADKTIWRLGLLLYCHVVEMDAPYEVITNLLRFRLCKGYSPSPFFDSLTDKEKKNFAKTGIRTGRKIEIIKELSKQSGLGIGEIFDEFYSNKLRNAVQHSDFIVTDEGFRCRSGSGAKAFMLSFEELDVLITKAKAFIAAFLQIETTARQVWGMQKGRAIPYDITYKGLMEILVDDRDLLCGFAVYWPNNSRSLYRRTKDGVEMVNCMIDLANATIDLFVDRYARVPGKFSPLVEHDASPVYKPLDKSETRPTWPL
ncbi:hypothetical protein [Ensifer sp. B1-9]|uniref:hypothetical protein n=1 Tax=Ensifer sp. B1-9 TaxID=3141455 RepID=UPI003D1B2902